MLLNETNHNAFLNVYKRQIQEFLEFIRYEVKNFQKIPLTSALFEISCGFKGGKDLYCAGLK